jgi:hypothetical protein
VVGLIWVCGGVMLAAEVDGCRLHRLMRRRWAGRLV